MSSLLNVTCLWSFVQKRSASLDYFCLAWNVRKYQQKKCIGVQWFRKHISWVGKVYGGVKRGPIRVASYRKGLGMLWLHVCFVLRGPGILVYASKANTSVFYHITFNETCSRVYTFFFLSLLSVVVPFLPEFLYLHGCKFQIVSVATFQGFEHQYLNYSQSHLCVRRFTCVCIHACYAYYQFVYRTQEGPSWNAYKPFTLTCLVCLSWSISCSYQAEFITQLAAGRLPVTNRDG